MRHILSADIGSELVVENRCYTITGKKEFMVNNTKAYRVTLYNEYENIFLEIKRELALNYQIFKYSLIESIKNNQNFLSILGTNTLGYNNPKLSQNNIYKKVRVKKENYTLIKHIVTEDELPEDYQSKGYYHDENGYYYFFTKKYSPLIKEFEKTKVKVWEYKQNNNLRLLVETQEGKNSKIFIYKGKELKNSEVTLLKPADRAEETLPQQGRIQRPNTPYFSPYYR